MAIKNPGNQARANNQGASTIPLFQVAQMRPEKIEKISMRYPVTPDRRYVVVKERLWRSTNPNLSEAEKSQWVKALMEARRAVKQALQNQDQAALKLARQQVHVAKVALGERGEVWWQDGAPDYNRHLVKNTPYGEWYVKEGLGVRG